MSEQPRVIAMHGHAQVGKDTVGKILADKYGFERRAFADKLKAVLKDLNPYLEGSDYYRRATDLRGLLELEGGWDGLKAHGHYGGQVRALMQNLGQAMREHVYVDVWADAAVMETVQTGRYVFTDVRYTNELVGLATWFGLDNLMSVWVHRPGVGPVNGHVSDAGLDPALFDIRLDNDGSLEELEVKVAELLDIWPVILRNKPGLDVWMRRAA